MAGRKDKNNVDYFPHYCTHGKTMFILESKFGHVGYAVWYKTLELLGNSDNHYIDLRDDTDQLYLISKLKITEQEFQGIYNLLAKMDAIDKDLWERKIIFSENFIKNIEDAYSRRNTKCLHKSDLCMKLFNLCIDKVDLCEQKSTEESKVEEIKEKEIIVETIVFPKVKTWKTDIEIYFTDLRNSFQSIKDDHVWIAQQELFNPGIDVILSIEKSCVNYWATEAGWKKKKSSKIINIDWKSTFANAISINKVYKSQSNGSNKQLQVGNNTEAERKRAIVAHATGESQPNEKAFF